MFFAGFDTKAVMAALNATNANTGRPNALYKQPGDSNASRGYQGARSARLNLKFTF